MQITRKSLFEGTNLQIGFFEARDVSEACGDVERQDRNLVVLPLSGVFAKHDAPGKHVLGTPSHAVFVAADTPFRLSYPGGIGDSALTLRFDERLAPEQLNGDAIASNALLPAPAMMRRNLLGVRLKQGDAEELELESIGLALLGQSLNAMRKDATPPRQSTQAQRLRALERVKEAVAVAPSHKWSVARLAKIANLSPFHLCHVFRQTVGTSIYDYVLRERLAHALHAVLDSGADLTEIALDAGFASHSHFTARFRGFFGCTPTALRRRARAADLAELRKIMTARPH